MVTGRRVEVADHLVCPRHHQVHLGRVVRRAHPLQIAGGPGQQWEGVVGLALCQQYGSASLVGPGNEAGRPEPVAGVLEGSSGHPSALDVPRGKPDLDLATQQGSTAEGVRGGVRHRCSDRRPGFLDGPRRQSQQRRPRLRISTTFLGVLVARCRLLVQSAHAVGLTQLVSRFSDRADVHVGQVVLHLSRLLLGTSPRSLGSQQLHPVGPTDTEEHHRVGEPGHPPLGRAGPLAGTWEVHQLAAGRQDRAVDVAGPLRGDSVGQHRDHRLVEDREPLTQPAAMDLGQALGEEPQGHERVVSELRAQPLQVACAGLGVVEAQLRQRGRGVEVADHAFGPTGRLALDQPAGSVQPPRSEDVLAPQEPHPAEIQGLQRRTFDQPVLEIATVEVLGDGQALRDPAEPPGRVGEHRQVIELERVLFTSGAKRPVRDVVLAPLNCSASRTEEMLRVDLRGHPSTVVRLGAQPAVVADRFGSCPSGEGGRAVGVVVHGPGGVVGAVVVEFRCAGLWVTAVGRPHARGRGAGAARRPHGVDTGCDRRRPPRPSPFTPRGHARGVGGRSRPGVGFGVGQFAEADRHR